jgi:hypothetical protein
MLSKYIEFLNREDIKTNIKKIINPIGEIVLDEIKPFLLYIAIFLFVHFIGPNKAQFSNYYLIRLV